MYTFLECGASCNPCLDFLLKDDWYIINEELGKEHDLHIPIPPFSKNVKWQGIFIEPLPAHISNPTQLPGLTDILLEVQPDTSRWEVYSCGLEVPNGFQTLIPSEPAHLLKHRDFGLRLGEYDDGIQLNTFALTLDDFIKYTGIYPTYIRMDIEGSEYRILEDYSFDYKPLMWNIEIHDADGKSYKDFKAPLHQLFQKQGYDTYELPEMHAYPSRHRDDGVIQAIRKTNG